MHIDIWDLWDSTWGRKLLGMRFELLSRDALPAAGADLARLAHHSALPILHCSLARGFSPSEAPGFSPWMVISLGKAFILSVKQFFFWGA